MSEKFLILDGNSILYRAFFALPKLKDKKGELTNAVYGFLLVLFKLIKELKPKYIAVCFDFPAPTFRHKEFKEYKATRPPTPKDLTLQIPKLKEILKAFSISYFEMEGFEADDLIGTLAKKAPSKIEKIIATGDQDILQLVKKNTRVYFLQRGVKKAQIFDRKNVKEKYKLEPEQIPDYKALVGDASDNILGIGGIGPKMAVNLLSKYKSIEGILKNIEKDKELRKEIKEKILENKEKLLLNLKLAKIKEDIPLKISFDKMAFGNYNEETVKKVLKKYGFKSLIKRLPELKKENNLTLFSWL